MERKELLEQARVLANEIFKKSVGFMRKKCGDKTEAQLAQKVFEMLSSIYLKLALEIVNNRVKTNDDKEKEIMGLLNNLIRNGTSDIESINISCSGYENEMH